MGNPYENIRAIVLSEDEVAYAREYLAARSTLSDSGCRLWTLSVNAPGHQGRPVAWIARRRFLASRLAWTVENGAIPAGRVICHSCDQPRCINLAHLFLGTPADNSHDRDDKGRFTPLPGETNGVSRHGDSEVMGLLARYDAGEFRSQHELAVAAGVSDQTASRWVRGITVRTSYRRERVTA